MTDLRFIDLADRAARFIHHNVGSYAVVRETAIHRELLAAWDRNDNMAGNCTERQQILLIKEARKLLRKLAAANVAEVFVCWTFHAHQGYTVGSSSNRAVPIECFDHDDLSVTEYHTLAQLVGDTKTTETVETVVLKPRRIDTGEYRVGVLVNGIDAEDRAYYTDDLDDAKATAQAMRKETTETAETPALAPCGDLDEACNSVLGALRDVPSLSLSRNEIESRLAAARDVADQPVFVTMAVFIDWLRRTANSTGYGMRDDREDAVEVLRKVALALLDEVEARED